jgi:hypothetical protein
LDNLYPKVLQKKKIKNVLPKMVNWKKHDTVNVFHSEMVNWEKHNTVNVFHSEMVTVNVFYSEMVNWEKQDMVLKTTGMNSIMEI